MRVGKILERIEVDPLVLRVKRSDELMSNLVYGLHDSGGLPADRSLVNSINKIRAGDDVGELPKAA